MSLSSLLPGFARDLSKTCYIKMKHLRKNIRFGRRVTLGTQTILEGNNRIGNRVNIRNSYIGRGTYIHEDTNLMYASIGRFCSIGSKVSVVIGQHPVKKYVSTHPAFFSNLKQAGFSFVEETAYKEFLTVDEEKKYSIKIGNDVWIGLGVMIMEGVTIGDGAVIGTGALVTKDVEPYSINVGLPAKKVGSRFSAAEIAHLLQNKWWEKDFSYLRQNRELFTDISDYINKG